MANSKSNMVVVIGPTAIGKTQLAIYIAEQFSGEIINTDSRQVYRYMDIGTAKPSISDRTRVPHHMIDINLPDTPALRFEPSGFDQRLQLPTAFHLLSTPM